jgi:UDPglucose 6-dehydrogenase
MEVAKQRLAALSPRIHFAIDEYDTLAGSHALVLATEWNQFRNLDPPRIKATLQVTAGSDSDHPCFFDLRDIYKREEVEAAGLRYFGVGA